MKTLLVAVNAKHIHTNPAVRVMRVLAGDAGLTDTDFAEFTINQSHRSVLAALYAARADVYVFSCYIWNIEMITALAADLRLLCPRAVMAAAGPQVSYNATGFLTGNPAFDYVLYGEGENSAPAFLRDMARHGKARGAGLVYRDGAGFATTPAPETASMDALPFAYEDMPHLSGRIIYYESMRGCPFSCSYCLSSIGKGVRTRSMALVREDLARFLAARVHQVKFVDRTFNALKDHAMAVWDYLIRNDNGVTNFHFELSGALIDADMLALLKKARPGLFQFEIGVQSCNEKTLREIARAFPFDKLS
ncbi:MAG: radical SAM protein, partial [Oscillospiraceae bacterium]|nr:radical SAM protein [Oscillospiraceae bacterium]